MNISGMRPYARFYDYNSIKAVELRSRQVAAAKDDLLSGENSKEETRGEEFGWNGPRQDYTSYDYAKTYRPDETYELKGEESDITSLDIQKAISDMEKDQVLRQYQYFVGTKDSGIKKAVSEQIQPSMRSGENFSL